MSDERCPELHNPGVWPYASRCVLPDNGHTTHVDRTGSEWATPTEEEFKDE